MAGEVKGSDGSVDGGTAQVACGVARSGGAMATLVHTGAALVRQEAAATECVQRSTAQERRWARRVGTALGRRKALGAQWSDGVTQWSNDNDAQ
ncbi:hypothetical protein U1Q18_034369 [Sarracenia purpurea var. burkii]